MPSRFVISEHMGIDGDYVPAAGEQQHAVRGLRADALDSPQLLPGGLRVGVTDEVEGAAVLVDNEL